MCTPCMQMRDKRDGRIPCAPTAGKPEGWSGMESQHVIDCAVKLGMALLLTSRGNSFIQGSLPCLSKLTKHTKHLTNWFLGFKLSLVVDCEYL